MFAVNTLLLRDSPRAAALGASLAEDVEWLAVRPAGAWIALLADPGRDLHELATKLSRELEQPVIIAAAADSDAVLTVVEGRSSARITTATGKRRVSRAAWDRALGSPTTDRVLSLWQGSLETNVLIERTASLLGIDPEIATSNFHELQLVADLAKRPSKATARGRASKAPARKPGAAPPSAPQLTLPARPKYLGAVVVFAESDAISGGLAAPLIAKTATQLGGRKGLRWFAGMPHPQRSRSGHTSRPSVADVRTKLRSADTLTFTRNDEYGPGRDGDCIGISVSVSAPGHSVRPISSPQLGVWFGTEGWLESDWDEAEASLRTLVDELSEVSPVVQAGITGWKATPVATPGLTHFESRVPIDQVCVGLRFWTDRWLRAPSTTIWLGTSFSSRLDPKRLPVDSDVATVGHEILRVTTPRKSVAELSEYLQPVLPSPADARDGAERAYETLRQSRRA